MTDRIIDLEQRNQALSPTASFIVQAPAGSGKTELLIQRYLRLLAVVGAPEEIIAITFTRKAAAEMRGRVMYALQMATTDALAGVTEKTRELARAAIARDKKYSWQLVDNPGRLRIQTIDSLCAFLTRQMPTLSRFGAQPQTLDDAGELYKQAAANTLAEIESTRDWSDAIATLLVHLDNDLPHLRNMLASMLARREQWLRHIASPRQVLDAALRRAVESCLQGIRLYLHEKLDLEWLSCFNFAARNLAWEHGEFSALPGAAITDLAAWQFIADLCLTKQNEWRKGVNKNQGFPAGTASKAMKDRFQGLLARLAEDDKARSYLAEIRALPAVHYTGQEWRIIEALYQLLRLADAQLRVLFAETNRIDFSGIAQAAIQSLGSEEAPSDLALHLDYRIQHILLDEFQDISVNQYVLLERLTAGWSGQDGHSLFLVGDPMQSIYRFREAEVGLFLHTWQEKRLGQLPLTPLHITLNFRSGQGIVDWVNNTFSQVLPHDADLSRSAVNYVRARAFHRQGEAQAVQYHPVPGRDDVQEAQTVTALVKSARENAPQERIAILVRNRSHLHEIIPALKQAGLSFRAVEIESLGRQAAIQDLLALTRALSHFADRIAWLAILRAPWCGLGLDDLFILAGKTREQTIWQCMNDEQKYNTLSHDGQGRLQRIRQVLAAAFAEQGRRHLSRWVESVWMRIGGPATLKDETALENTRTFFALLDRFDQGGRIKERAVFMQQVADLFAASEGQADDTLQLMTIHKAKGLEFDTVILPGLSRGSGSDKTSLLLWMELSHHARQDLLLAPIKKAGDAESPIYRYLKHLENEKQHYEAGRLLYVAATRAKKKLHILGTVKVKPEEEELQVSAPKSNSLLAQIWPVVKEDFAVLLTTCPLASETERSVPLTDKRMIRLQSDWQLPNAPSPAAWQGKNIDAVSPATAIEFAWASETIKHIGSVVHRYIQLFAEQGLDNWRPERVRSGIHNYAQLLKSLGVIDSELAAASKRVAEALTNLLEDPKGRWLLAKEHMQQANEYAVSGLYQGRLVHVIIDRTFVDKEGIRWIVDYKTGRHEGRDREDFLEQERQRYKDQLEKYACLLSDMEDRPVKLGLYFPLLKGWKEWEYSSR